MVNLLISNTINKVNEINYNEFVYELRDDLAYSNISYKRASILEYPIYITLIVILSILMLIESLYFIYT